MTWTKSAIRNARRVSLAPLLIDRGYRLHSLSIDNYRILPDPDDPSAPAGLLVKQNFWIWAEKNLSGNPIDFFLNIEHRSFHDAMLIITAKHPNNPSEQNIPKERGLTPKTLR